MTLYAMELSDTEAAMAAENASFDRIIAAWDPETSALPADVEAALCDEWERSSGWPLEVETVQSAATVLEVLVEHGFPEHVAEHLAQIAGTFRPHDRSHDGLRATGVLPEAVAACASAPLSAPVDPFNDTPAAGDAVLTAAVDAAVVVGRWLEGHMVTVAQGMNIAAGRELLSREGVAAPDELTKTKRAQWRANSKASVANEFRLLTGRSLQACHDLVGFAMAPPEATAPARAAMAAGEADWYLARTWYDRCRNLPYHDAATIGARVFPGLPSTAEADTDGDRVTRPSVDEFHRNLAREVTHMQGTDPAAERAKRKQARADRAMFLTADDDGTATVSLRGPTSAVVGAYDRVDVIARKARAAGDERTLNQLRVDATLGLMMHGTLMSGEQSRAGARHGAGADSQARDAGDRPLVDLATLEQVVAGLGPVHLDVIVPLDALTNPHSTAVAEIANHGLFLTAEHAREIALTPGTTLHRLLTDPATGICVERSIKSYAPDAAMRAQIAAIDRLCRAPGCTVPAARCQLDHIEPFDHANSDQGGPTAIGNLANEHIADHSLKTRGLVHVLIDPETRRMTWRTLFGRIYHTLPHDYSQYTAPPAVGSDADHPGTETWRSDARSLPAWPAILDLPEGPNLNDIDVRDRLIYAALTERTLTEDSELAGWDDFDDAQHLLDMGWPFEAPIDLYHHTSGGAPRRGPDKSHSRTDQLLHPNEPTHAEVEARREDAKDDAANEKPPPF